MQYQFYVQALQEKIIVEAETVEDARMKIIDGEVDTILNNSCETMGVDAHVSDGKEI